ncbi:MAG: ABC transporter ATP-binding protein [Terriglobales bacterium]|jgi:oligopeptide/dipeptide ABC transporter ATP-binding protein
MDGAPDLLARVRDLTVTYFPDEGLPIRAVDGVSLEIHPGKIVGVLGESGCGKSTLASALLRLLPPTAKCGGAILFRGRDLLNLSEAELRALRGRDIALIPQDPALSLNPVMTAGALIGEVLRAHLPLTAGQRRQRVIDLLGEVGFDHPNEIYFAYPHQLSGGQRQRIAIAQAIACRPALLIADEPTSKLDASLQGEIVTLLAKIRHQHGTAILIISHDPALFAGFADRIAVMYAGRIVETGSSAEILGQPLHPYSQALMRIAASSLLTGARARVRLPAITGESPDPGCVPDGCRFGPRCSERMDVCSQRYPQAFLPAPSRPVNCFKYGE